MKSVRVEAEVNLTEDLAKVRKAVENMFSGLQFEERSRVRGSSLVAWTNDLESVSKFGELLRRERIRDAARVVLLQGLRGNIITFYLNKQVAYVGHISFCEPVGESPLGPIKVEIQCPDPAKLIDQIAPKSERQQRK